MKCFYFSIVFLLSIFYSHSQNLVLNPDLEIFSTCPLPSTGMASCTDWHTVTNHWGDPDYYNICAMPGVFGVPTNGFGTQNAQSGSAYIGMVLYNTGDYKEYVYGTLSSPMVAGLTYDISFWVNLADVSSFATDNGLGLHLSSTIPSGDIPVSSAAITSIIPQIQNTIVIDDKLNWMPVNFQYIATGGEQYMTIGNFMTDANTNKHDIGAQVMQLSYIYLDNFTVEAICEPAWTKTTICSTDPFLDLNSLITGTPGGVWSGIGVTGTIFDPSFGSQNITYSTPCNVDSSQTITVVPNPVANFLVNDTMGCAPLLVNFTDNSSSTSDAINSWNWFFGDGHTATNQHPMHAYETSGTYTIELVTTTLTGCSSTVIKEVQITVQPKPLANFSIGPNPAKPGDLIQFTTESPDGQNWAWQFGDGTYSNIQNPTHTYTDLGTFPVRLTVGNEFCTNTAIVHLIIEEELMFYIPNAFTPDGDQYNNTFLPVFTGGYDPYDYQLLIFNRWGELLFESHDTSIGWNGKYGNKALVLKGVYVWKINVLNSHTNERHTFNGQITVL